MKNRRSAPRTFAVTRVALRSSAVATFAVALAMILAYEANWAIRFVTAHPYFTLSEVHVQGNRRLKRDDVLRWADLNSGMSSWDASPDAIRFNLLRNPWVSDVDVEREFPNGLTIRISERRPTAIVRLDQLYYVDRHGQTLGPVGSDDSRDFPLITGLGSPSSANFSAAGIRHALRLLRLCARDNRLSAVSEVFVEQDYGPTVFPSRPAIGVRLGWGNWRRKLDESQRVLKAWDGRTDQVRMIDLSYRNRAVVQLKESPLVAKNENHKKGTRI